MAEYDPLFSTTHGTDNMESVFRTQRPNQPEGVGSTYAQFADDTTVRNRSGEGHTDKTEGIQPRSGKTIFMAPQDVDRLAEFQNPDSHTRLDPVLKDGKPTGRAALKFAEDFGPRKAGTVIHEAQYESRPKVGLTPVEIWDSKSPVGSSGRGVHFGNKISEVHPRPSSGGGAGKAMPFSPEGGMKPGQSPSLDNPILRKKGGSIKMPDSYSSGSWKII